MKSLRSSLALPMLNKARTKLLALPQKDASSYFESITGSPKLPILPLVADDTVANIPIRVYSNKAPKGVMIYAHGGGFIHGSLNSHDQLARLLAKKTGRFVISVGYSLAPKYKHPVPVNEMVTIIDYLADIGKKYAIDTADLTLCGDSAGGFIALHAAQKSPIKIHSLILLYPCIKPYATTDSMKLYSKKYFLHAKDMRTFWKQYLGSAEVPTYTEKWLEPLPPTLILTAEYDILRDEAKELHNKLRNAGKTSQYKKFKGMWHGFMQTPSPISDRAKAFKVIKHFIDLY